MSKKIKHLIFTYHTVGDNSFKERDDLLDLLDNGWEIVTSNTVNVSNIVYIFRKISNE